jgi:hypothetical protein
MWYGGEKNNNSDCPDGSRHSYEGSGNYSIEYGNDYEEGKEQPGWRWCRRCYCLCYSENGSGYCPSGSGGHNFEGSGKYYLPYG